MMETNRISFDSRFLYLLLIQTNYWPHIAQIECLFKIGNGTKHVRIQRRRVSWIAQLILVYCHTNDNNYFEWDFIGYGYAVCYTASDHLYGKPTRLWLHLVMTVHCLCGISAFVDKIPTHYNSLPLFNRSGQTIYHFFCSFYACLAMGI